MLPDNKFQSDRECRNVRMACKRDAGDRLDHGFVSIRPNFDAEGLQMANRNHGIRLASSGSAPFPQTAEGSPGEPDFVETDRESIRDLKDRLEPEAERRRRKRPTERCPSR